MEDKILTGCWRGSLFWIAGLEVTEEEAVAATIDDAEEAAEAENGPTVDVALALVSAGVGGTFCRGLWLAEPLVILETVGSLNVLLQRCPR